MSWCGLLSIRFPKILGRGAEQRARGAECLLHSQIQRKSSFYWNNTIGIFFVIIIVDCTLGADNHAVLSAPHQENSLAARFGGECCKTRTQPLLRVSEGYSGHLPADQRETKGHSAFIPSPSHSALP